MLTTLLRAADEAPEACDESKFVVLCQAAFDGILVHDAGTIIEANEKCAAMFGTSIAGLLDRSVFDLTAPEKHEILDQHIRPPDLVRVERPEHPSQPHELGGVHDGDHWPDVHRALERRIGEHVQHLARLGHTGGLDDHAPGGLLVAQLLERVHERALQRAAEAPGADLDHVDAVSGQDGAVDADVAELVDEDGRLQPLLIGQDVVEQGGLATAEEARDDRDGQLVRTE